MLLSYKAGRHWRGTGNSSNDDEDEDDSQRGNNHGAYNVALMSPSASSRAVAVKNLGNGCFVCLVLLQRLVETIVFALRILVR